MEYKYVVVNPDNTIRQTADAYGDIDIATIQATVQEQGLVFVLIPDDQELPDPSYIYDPGNRTFEPS